jgi:outer membrane protein
MKKICLFVGSLLVLSFSSISFAEMKIGVVDINKVLESSPQVKKIREELKKKFDPRGQEIISLQNTFRSDIESYKKNNTSMKGEALKNEQKKLIDENKKLQKLRLDLQNDLITTQNNELRPVLKKIEDVVKKISKEQKFDLIIAKTSTVFTNPQFEITDKVISEM